MSAVAQSPERIEVLLVGDVMSPDGRLEGLVAFDDILEVMSEELGELVGLVAREQKREREVRK
jgi:hypothetical protein